MSSEEDFIRENVESFVHSECPGEEIHLDLVFREMERMDFAIGEGSSGDLPIGLGADEILELLKSPYVIATLSAIWGSLIAPVIKEVAVYAIRNGLDNRQATDEATKRLSEDRFRKYLVQRGKKSKLDDDEARKLAKLVTEWVRRHPEEIGHLIEEQK